MESIIPIQGKVKHVITLDPTVWIFDDRRIDLTTYFTQEQINIDEMEQYKKDMGKHWSREIMEGATFPPTLKTEAKYEKTKMLTGTFGILLQQFIRIAGPAEDAKTIVFELANGEEFSVPLEEGDRLIFKFSDEGKPLREDGPVHLLFTDGSNQNDPVRNIHAIRID
ncbi:peptidyl-prolyl cis-trans isomerase [Sporosarcina sp. FSL W7-1349]|uniref:peptidyl-prolyl cis-trans isomerase n=1 Tax=Sporosarcina sp. FSL W7-1349 TaxID=2921561 RepID=UPI0030F67258